jgi:ubiquinone/menaquinone biosynthesis C-methylase UbiE
MAAIPASYNHVRDAPFCLRLRLSFRTDEVLEPVGTQTTSTGELETPDTKDRTPVKRVGESDSVAAERQRMLAEYARREREVDADLYAPWQPATTFIQSGRKQRAASMLHRAGTFPDSDTECLEVGCGALGWLGDLITWGVPEMRLHGIELNRARIERACGLLPSADLQVGTATQLPWQNETFQLVIASTVFTSILDTEVRYLVAREIARVLAPGGALLWYDFAVNNPRNPHVRRVDRGELRQLFPELSGEIKSITLAPPIARFIVPKSWVLGTILEAIPFLRTHLIAVLMKK